MKRLSEREVEHQAAARVEKQAQRIRREDLLAKLSTTDIPLYRHGDEPADLDEETSRRRRARARLMVQEGDGVLSGVACDHCGLELFIPYPKSVEFSGPPKRQVVCPGCGWQGWMTA